MTAPEDGGAEVPAGVEPVRLSMADLLRLADAFPLLDRLVLMVTLRAEGDRATIVFGVLHELRDHLEATAPADVEETIDAIRAWFDGRIADEENRRGERA